MFKEEHGHRCPSPLNVTGVELVYNPAEDDIKKKTDRLHQILTNFNADPDPSAIPEAGHIQASRATDIRAGLLESKEYWDAYHEKMKQLEGTTGLYSSFTFQHLPAMDPVQPPELEDEATYALQSLESEFEAVRNYQRVTGDLDGAAPPNRSLAAAYAILNEAAQLYLKAEDIIMEFRAQDLKYLCKPGMRKKKNETAWDPSGCAVGDLVLVQVDPTWNEDRRAWDIGVVVDPETCSVANKGAPGLHVAAGLPGRDKVR